MFAVLAAVLLAHTVGQRHPGQQITGDAQSGGRRRRPRSTGDPIAGRPRRPPLRSPKSYAAQIRTRAALLSTGACTGRDPGVPRGRASSTRPRPSRSRTRADLTALLGEQETTRRGARNARSRSRPRISTRRSRVDPTYPDSYVFKGVLLTQIENKQCAGRGRVPAVPRDRARRPSAAPAGPDRARDGDEGRATVPSRRPHQPPSRKEPVVAAKQDARAADRRRRRSTASRSRPIVARS